VSRKRTALIVAGFVVILAGGLYSWWAATNNPVNRGWEAYLAEDYDQAIAHFTQALRDNPRNAQAYVGRSWARANKIEAGRLKAFEAADEWERVVADSTQAIRLDPDSGKAYAVRGKARAALGQVSEAMKDLDEAVRRAPHSAIVYFQRAQVADRFRVKDAKPLQDVTEAIRLNPDFAPAHTLQGELYLRQGRNDEAVRSCNRALALAPKLAPAYLYRGLARLARGQEREAEEDFRRALQLDPNLPIPTDLPPVRRFKQ
jgi:serine/threonine-protein kinase